MTIPSYLSLMRFPSFSLRTIGIVSCTVFTLITGKIVFAQNADTVNSQKNGTISFGGSGEKPPEIIQEEMMDAAEEWNESIAKRSVYSTAAGQPILVAVDTLGPKDAKPLRILFLGNDIFFVPNIPEAVQSLVASVGPRRMIVGQVGLGGAWVGALVHSVVAKQLLRTHSWDYVVIQGHLRWPAIIDRRMPGPMLQAADTTDYLQGIREVATLLTRNNPRGRVIVYDAPLSLTGYDPYGGTELREALARRAAAEVQGRVVRHAKAIQGLQRDSTLRYTVFGAGIYASQQGAYLAALLIYQAMTGTSPIGLPFSFVKGLTEKDAKKLQIVADSLSDTRS